MKGGTAAGPRHGRSGRVVLLTVLALCAFAGNSVLGRAALGDGSLDPASFASLRLLSGALALAVLCAVTGRGSVLRGGDGYSASLLFLYAVPFSFAYTALATGTGALILFGAVQATMLIAGLRSGERPHLLQWVGTGLAIGGLVYLVLPGVEAPSPVGSAWMAVAGVAWGLYSLHGRQLGGGDPVLATGGNFLRSVPPALLVSAIHLDSLQVSASGVGLAVASGALASGVGYAIWYAALPSLSASIAATVQLSVPVVAAVAGVLLLSEAVGLRLVVASIAILGGVGLALYAARSPTRS